MKSLFEQLVDEIDAAIVDVTLSKIPKGDKAKKLRMLIQARDYQLHVAGIMDHIYPKIKCADSDSLDYCKKIHCPRIFVCESKALKRLRIEGRIIRALDELPVVKVKTPLPCSGDCGINGIKIVNIPCRKGMDTPPSKIDPCKTWIY